MGHYTERKANCQEWVTGNTDKKFRTPLLHVWTLTSGSKISYLGSLSLGIKDWGFSVQCPVHVPCFLDKKFRRVEDIRTVQPRSELSWVLGVSSVGCKHCATEDASKVLFLTVSTLLWTDAVASAVSIVATSSEKII